MSLFGRSRDRATIVFPTGDAIVNAHLHESLTASAERATPEKAAKYRRLSQPWQREAFRYYVTLGECWYPAQFYAKALAKLRIFAARIDEQGETVESEPDTWEAQQLDRIQDPGGGRSRLMQNYGRLWFLIGETYLLGETDTATSEERWEFLSSSELRALGTGRDTSYVRYEWPGANPEQIGDAGEDEYQPVGTESVVYRFWNPHPEYSRLADSPVRAVLPIYSQLELLEASFLARLKSRLAAAGIVVLADEVTFGSPDGENDDDPKSDPVARQLQQAFIRPIQNPSSAGAVAPIVIRAPGHMIAEKSIWDHLQIHNPNEVLPELEQWEKAVQRVALGLDMPPEILLGMTDANHWTAWQIDDQTWVAHLQPVAQSLVDNLGSAFLRPLARQEGVEYANELVVGYDAAEIINHPDRTQDAKDLHDRLVIGDETLRTVAGFEDDDAPTPEEITRGILLKVRNAAALPEFQSTLPVQEGPPDEQQAAQEHQQAEESQISATAYMVRGAAEVALDRTLERAGARIVSQARTDCPECATKVKGLPNALVASAIGADVVGSWGLDRTSLVAGGADSLRRTLPGWGVALHVTERIAGLVEQHAANCLYDPQPLPPGVVETIDRAVG